MVIKETKLSMSTTQKCKVLNVNRSSYYKWLNSKPYYDDSIDKLIVDIFNKHKGTYGRKRIKLALELQGYKVNHKKIYRIMCEQNIKARIRRKWRAGKYIKHHTYTNVLNREFKVDEPGKKYVSDVTQFKSIDNKKYYLYPIVDLYNNEIKAFSVYSSNNNYLVKQTLDKLDLSGVEVMYSDQGSQFTPYMYSEELKKYKGLKISMSHVGECYDNAQMESIFGHIKNDFYTFFNPKTEQELYENMDSYINYYNNERIQIRLKMSPIQYRTHQF